MCRKGNTGSANDALGSPTGSVGRDVENANQSMADYVSMQLASFLM